ncbi:hypothetical protein M3J09_009558 [Ascochyta lentis]
MKTSIKTSIAYCFPAFQSPASFQYRKGSCATAVCSHSSAPISLNQSFNPIRSSSPDNAGRQMMQNPSLSL